MRILQSFIVRAACALVVGYLLVIYRTDMLQWLTMAIGALFFISGLLSLGAYLLEHRKARHTARQLQAMADERGGGDVPKSAADIERSLMPAFPIVGVGSVILGIILGLMPAEFIRGTMYALAAMLILGALSQFYNLFCARRLTTIPLFFWLFPCVVLGVGIYMVARPIEAGALPFRVLGWGLMLYGVVECINGIKIFQARRHYEQAYEELRRHVADSDEIEEAVIVDDSL